MKRESLKYMAVAALGFSLFAAGCEKKDEDAASQSTLGLASPSNAEKSGTGEGAVAPNPGYDQGSPGASKDQNPESAQKSQSG